MGYLKGRFGAAQLLAALTIAGALGSARASTPVILVDPVTPESRALADAAIRAFPRLKELSGYPARWADQVRQAPVVVAVGSPAWAEARAHATAPLVASMVSGLDIAELPKKATGVRVEVDPAELLNQLKSLLSDGKVTLFIGPSLSDFRIRARAAAGSLGVTLVEHVASDPLHAREDLLRLEPGCGAIWLGPDPHIMNEGTVGLALEMGRKLHTPVIGFSHSLTRAGALASLSQDEAKAGTETGELAKGLAERAPDESAAAIPVIRFAPASLTLNAKTAQELGIHIPDQLRMLATYLFR